MRVLAVGDIHGCSRAFDAVLAAARLEPGDTLVTLGDYVDRGPDSSGVLRRLCLLSTSPDLRLIALRGNHEQMMLDARENRGALEEWLHSGGDATLASYSVLGDQGRLADVPDEHWELLEHRCVDWHENDTHFFVHANAYPEMALGEQPAYMLRWETFRDPPPHESGKVMVCGHTPQRSGFPRNIGHAVCIDTRAYKPEGWLTGLDTTTGRVLQANQAGEIREAWADDFLG